MIRLLSILGSPSMIGNPLLRPVRLREQAKREALIELWEFASDAEWDDSQ
jgi:hypothetical protein